MDEGGMPSTAAARVELAEKILEHATARGIDPMDVYFDPLVRPVGAEPDQALEVMKAVRIISMERKMARTTMGLSNVSFGLPGRKHINRAFLIACMANGLDSAILDPLDEQMIRNIYCTDTLMNRDEYCMNYIGAFREGKIR